MLQSESVAPGDRAARLRRISVLRALPEAELQALEQRCRWLRARAGQQIVDRQSDNRDVFFVVAGRVRVVDFSRSGREVVYAMIEAGGYFGELAAIDGAMRSAAVIAEEDCLLASLAPEGFESLLRRHPDIALALIRDLVTIIRTSDERITDLATLGAVQRVCRELTRLAKGEHGASGAWVISRLPPQRAIASQAGTTRETVARALAQLGADGIVERKGRALRIRDPSRLEALIEGLDAVGSEAREVATGHARG